MAVADPAELSSLASTLEEVTARVAAMAEAAAADEESQVGPELFEIERGLQGAARRLAKLVESLP